MAKENVVLLHGLARSASSFKKLEKTLNDEGYQVYNINYPSRKFTIEVLASKIRTQLEPVIKDGETIHFVTHSMGGILLRQIQCDDPIKTIGRVVMLSPPNNGSEVVDVLGELSAFEWLNGPAGNQLGTGPDSAPNTLPAVDFELGIITGDRSINWGLSMLIPGKDDGKVSVKSAKVEGMKSFRVVHASHPLIMKNSNVIEMVTFFLKNGSFE